MTDQSTNSTPAHMFAYVQKFHTKPDRVNVNLNDTAIRVLNNVGMTNVNVWFKNNAVLSMPEYNNVSSFIEYLEPEHSKEI